MGRLFGICVLKGSELKENDPRRKYKYRVVFQGNNVINQNWEAAIFQDLGSAPASMEAGKVADCYGCLPGHATQQADAEQAYVQAKLTGRTTWVALPPDQWPDEWRQRGMHRLVVKLDKALYGHPDSGTMWEKHCDSELLAQGFVPIEHWPSCYFHERLKLMLAVYVDDFKLSGPKENLAQGWKLIGHGRTGGITLEAPSESGLYLGCKHEIGTTTVQPTASAPAGTPATVVSYVTYNMEEFLQS